MDMTSPCREVEPQSNRKISFRFGWGDTLKLSIMATIGHDLRLPGGVTSIESMSEASLSLPAGANASCTLRTAAKALVEHLIETMALSFQSQIMAAFEEQAAKDSSAMSEAAADLCGAPSRTKL